MYNNSVIYQILLYFLFDQGRWILGYIPVMVVGALIFHFGIEFMKEALIGIWGITNHLEYITVLLL